MAMTILVVEDDDSLRRAVQLHLEKMGYVVTTCLDAETALQVLDQSPFDILLTDMHLPGLSGLDLLKRARLEHPELIAIVATAYGTVAGAVEAMRLGAYDYLTKPIQLAELDALIRRGIDHRRLAQEVTLLRSTLSEKYGFENVIGSSTAFRQTINLAARAAASDATVLITGETGTGKEVLAKAIHMASSRRDKPIVTINCGSIPRELLESELFGHVKGSFTGALTHKKGRVEAADGGTVFLDEIGEMPFELQVRILRLIQEREIDKIGSTKPTRVDVRIIAATHRKLENLIEDGTFRQDLYYRLAVVPIHIPALRERPSDVLELLEYFFEKGKKLYGRTSLRLPAQLLPAFSSYRWPGNVRELENLVERLIVLCDGNEIRREDLPEAMLASTSDHNSLHIELPPGGLDLESVEKELLTRALQKFGGNQTKAAAYLNLSRKTFLYRLEKFGILKPGSGDYSSSEGNGSAAG
jgi:two-component system NtrC family response regulator